MQAKSGSIAEIVTKTKETAEKVAQQQAEIKKNAKVSKVNIKELAPSAGKWSVDPKIDMDTLTSKQTAAVSYLKAVSEVSGMNITLMSGVDVTGAFAVENGHYDGVTNTLYVSVNAGMQSITDITGSAILKTASHEITHYIAASGTQTYSLLEDYVMSRFTEQYGEKSVDNRIEDIQEQYKDQVGKELTREQAKEEMVAAACEMMLKNSEVFEKLARQNLTLAQRIKAGLDGFVKKLSANRKAAFENLDATSPEARAIAASETSLKETQKLWDNALKGAIKENQRVSDSQVNSSTTEMQNPDVMQNLRTMTEDYWAYRNDAVLKGLLTKQEYDELFNTINVIMDKARNNPDILDFGADIESENRPFSAIKPNSDPLYKVSLDFSTLCRKRLLQQAIVNKLQSKLKRSLTATEQTQIRNELVKLRKEGKKIEVACALCYVEAARLKSPDVINDFLENRRKYAVDYFSKKNKEFNKLIEKQQGDYLASQNIKRNAKKSEMPKTAADYLNTNKPVWRQQYKPSVSEEAAIKVLVDMDAAELLSAQGLARLRLANPVAYDIYISRVRTATKSKAQETNMPFKRGDTYGFIDGNGRKTTVISNALIAAMNAENGLRYQSWSDFQAMHILDNIAAVMELSTRKAKMQTYTKVPDFVMLNGKTGMMINMSLLAQGNGFSETGGFAFDPYEGMPFKEMQRLRDMFPETAGNIVVGVSDEHVRALLASKDIDYVIPYHLSGLNENLRFMMSIEAWVDYTRTQGEKFNGKENSGGAKNWHKAPRFGEWFDAVAAAQAKDGYAFMQEAAQKYLNLCEERGLVPKFEEFKNEANYWKLLIDRKMVNQETGKVIIQQAVKPIFDENAIAVANNAIQDEQAIKDFHEVQDSLVKQITSGKIEISKRMTAELAAMYNAPYVSGIEGQNNSKMYELRGYSEKEVNSWANSKRIIIYRDNIQLEEFINEALNNKNYDRKMYFGKIPANLAEDIRNILAKDIDVGGYNCALDSYHIRKINASHGNEVNERLLGQRGVTVNDYETIPSVISNPDSLTDQGLYNGKPAIGFVKYINGEKFTVIGVISDKHMDLFVQTSYIGAKKGSLSTRASAKTDTITPEARRGTAPDNNIADSTDAVNTSSPDIHLELRSDENQFNPRKELSNLFMQIAQNEQEKKSLRSYQAAIHELNNTEIEISKLQQEMQGTDKLKSPQKYYELQNKLRQAEAKLNRYDGRLVQLEATKPMKDLIARREQRLKEQFARSSTTRAKYRNNIKKNIRSLDKKLRTNSGQKHVLLELQPVVAQLLNVFTENTSVFKKEQLAKLREIYAKFNPEADSKISSNEKEVTRWKSTAEYSSAYSEMIYDLIEEVRPLVQGKRLIDLDTDLLAAVNDIVGNIKQKSAVSKSLPRRRFSVVDQSEHFTAKPPLKKYVFVRTSFGGGEGN